MSIPNRIGTGLRVFENAINASNKTYGVHRWTIACRTDKSARVFFGLDARAKALKTGLGPRGRVETRREHSLRKFAGKVRFQDTVCCSHD